MAEAVKVTLRIQNSGVQFAGFGKALILSHNASFPDRLRTYTSYAGVVDDGFAADSPEALASAALFAQAPAPTEIAIGRVGSAVTQRYEIDAATVANSTLYALDVVGEDFDSAEIEYTSDAAATQAEIHAGLVTALNAVTDKTFTAAFAALVVADKTFTGEADDDTLTASAHGLLTGDGPFQVANSGGALPSGLTAVTNYWIIRTGVNTFQLATTLANALAGTAVALSTDGTGTQTLADTVSTVRPDDPFTVTADAAGAWFSLALRELALLKLKQTHGAGSLADELAAIKLADDTWYWIVPLYTSKAYGLAVAAFAEANGKACILAFDDVESLTASYSVGVSTDALAAVTELGYKRTLHAYHHAPAEMMAAAWTGVLAALNPGSWTAKFKTLSGVSVTPLSPNHRTNLEARRGNGYGLEFGVPSTFEGTVGNLEFGFLDVVVGTDAFVDDLKKSVFGAQKAMAKVAYEDRDIAVLEAKAIGATKRYSSDERPVLRRDPAPIVRFPLVASVDPSIRATRVLPDARVTAELSGAVHNVELDVTLSF